MSPRVRLLCVVLVTLAIAFAAMLWIRQSVRDATSAFLLMLSLFRVYSLVRSDVWIWRRGLRYREMVNSKKKSWNPDNRQLLRIYSKRRIRGDFFPFGIRAIVLQVAYQGSTGLRKIFLLSVYRLWKYYFFVPIIALVMYGLYGIRLDNLSTVARYLGFATALVLAFGALVIAVEAALCYFTFGSWSLGYHRFDVGAQRGTAELAALIGGVATALTANAVGISLASRFFGAFGALHEHRFAGQIGLGFYFTLTSLTGNGDAGPVAWQGFVVMALLYIEAAAYLIVVVSLLLDSLGSEPGIHLPWLRRR